jgi:hypothetical protein
MSLSSYDDLKTAIATFALRPGDSVISASVDDYIDMAEAQMMRGMEAPFPFPSRPLRARQMETRDTAYAIDAEFETLPTGYLEHIHLRLDSSPKVTVEYVAPQIFDQLYASTVTDTYPRIFTIVGSQARFAPTPAAEVTGIFTYYQEITPLDDDNTSNWILVDAPHLYLYGALMHAYLMIDQEPSPRAQSAAAAFTGGLNSLNTQEQKSRYGRTPVARTLTGTP